MINDEPLLRSKEKATLTIAYTLLFTFVGCLVFFAVAASLAVPKEGKADEVYKTWMSLFKDSLLLVATALTTIIGYYFGQRESAQAYKEAADAKATLPAAEKVITRLRDELETKMVKEDLSNDSENFNHIRNKQIPKK